MSENKKNHNRAPDKAQTSIAVPKTLLETIQTLADQQMRTRNNMIEVLLTEAVNERKHMIAAEEGVQYGKKK